MEVNMAATNLHPLFQEILHTLAPVADFATPKPAQQLKEDWLAERRRFIGGSDSASLFPEETKYGCTTRLWFDKNNRPADYARPEQEEKILKRGQIWENIVALYFSEYTGMKVRRIGQRISKTFPIMGVNMDRQIVGVTTEQLKAAFPNSTDIQAMEGDCGPGYLECKTANPFMYAKMLKDGVPNDYVLQVNHGLVVTGYKWGVFAVLEPSFGEFSTFPYVWKPNLGQEQISRAIAFNEILLTADKPPLPAVLDSRCKGCLWRKSCPRYDELLKGADKEFTAEGYVTDDSLAELVTDYLEASEIAEQKQETVDLIKGRIQEALGERTKVEVPSAAARISWAPTKPPQRWDAKALEGTVEVLHKWDIPDDAKCEEVGCEQPAAAIYQTAEAHPLLWYMCEVCAAKNQKLGRGKIVARKDVAGLVANCKHAGAPSRPFKVVTL
jgi:predicted phage-related endonuclease